MLKLHVPILFMNRIFRMDTNSVSEFLPLPVFLDKKLDLYIVMDLDKR